MYLAASTSLQHKVNIFLRTAPSNQQKGQLARQQATIHPITWAEVNADSPRSPPFCVLKLNRLGHETLHYPFIVSVKRPGRVSPISLSAHIIDFLAIQRLHIDTWSVQCHRGVKRPRTREAQVTYTVSVFHGVHAFHERCEVLHRSKQVPSESREPCSLLLRRSRREPWRRRR